MACHIAVFTLDALAYYLAQPNLPLDFLESLLSKKLFYMDNYMDHIDISNITKPHLEKLHQHGLDQWWRLFDLIRFTYYEIKPIRQDVIEYVFKMGQSVIPDRLSTYFGTDDYPDLRRYLITNFRTTLSECNDRGELGLIRMTQAAVSDLTQAGFTIQIKNLSSLMMADADHLEYYHFDPELVEQPTQYFPISDQWRLHLFKVLDVDRIWHLSVLRLVIKPTIDVRSSYPVEYLCCFEEVIRSIIWLRTSRLYKNTLHQIINNCRYHSSSKQLPAVINLWHQAGYSLDQKIKNIRPIELCLSLGLIESAELLIHLGVNPAGTTALKYLVSFSKPIQIKILNQTSEKHGYVLHDIIDKCSNPLIDNKLMTTIQLLGTYNYPIDEKKEGATPLSRCLYKDYQNSAKALVQLGASIYTIVDQHCYLGNFYEEYNWLEEVDKLASLEVYFGNEKLVDFLLRRCPSKVFELIRKHGYKSQCFFLNYCLTFPDICLEMLPSIKEDVVLTEVCQKMLDDVSVNSQKLLDLFRLILSFTSKQINRKTKGLFPIDVILTKKNKNKLHLALAILPYYPVCRPLISSKNIGNKFVKDTIDLYFSNRLFWSPTTHKYFPPVFQSTVFHLCLVTNRFKDLYYRVPKVILYYIIEWLEKAYLPI